MKLTKKLLAIMLSLIMVFTMIAVPVSATGTTAEDTTVGEIVDEEATDEEAADEETTGQFSGIFDAIRNLIEAIHNLVGNTMGALGKECPFCDKVHGKDEGTDEALIAIDKDSFGYDEETKTYFINGLVEEVNGILKNSDSAKSLKYEVVDNNKNVIDSGSIDVAENWSFKDIGLIIGNNIITVTVKYSDGSEFNDSVEVVCYSEANFDNVDLDIEKDTDGDGIPDYLEDIMGGDKYSDDTDGDGLTDYQEEVILIYESTKADTDGDGISDYNEDYDDDGIIDGKEFALGTDPLFADSDIDGLTDLEEMEQYGTNPNEEDTDKDGANDGEEIRLATDPLVANEKFVEKFAYDDSEKGALIVPSVEIELTGEQVGTLEIKEVDTLNALVPGFIEKAFDFSVDGEFEKATLTFTYDMSIGNIGSDFQPRIYYFNEAKQILEELPNQKVEDGKVSVEVEHFSTYILLNKVEFDKVWESEIKKPDYEGNGITGLDVVFVIDSSGSMSWNDGSGIRKFAAMDFVEKLGENDRAAVVDFDSYSYVRSGFSSDQTVLFNAINSVNDSGGTNLSAGISAAINLFTDESYNRTDAYKYIIMLTDGDGSYDYSYTTTAANNEIVIYTVGLGSGVRPSVLQGMSNGTGGKYYFASAAYEITDIYTEIEFETIDYQKDSNGDGISDYYAQLLYEGKLCTGTGSNEYIGEDFNKSNDIDNDGLLNGEELKIETYGDRVYVTELSDPTVDDTDGDGFNDGIEKSNNTDINKRSYSKIDYNYIVDDNIYSYISIIDSEDNIFDGFGRTVWKAVTFDWSQKGEAKDLLSKFLGEYLTEEAIKQTSDEYIESSLGELEGKLIDVIKTVGEKISGSVEEKGGVAKTIKAIKKWTSKTKKKGFAKKELKKAFEELGDIFNKFIDSLDDTGKEVFNQCVSKIDIKKTDIGFILLDEAMSLYDVVTAYADIYGAKDEFDKSEELLNEIINSKDNSEFSKRYVRKAASEIKSYISEESKIYWHAARDFIGLSVENVCEFAVGLLNAHPVIAAVNVLITGLEWLTPLTAIADADYHMFTIKHISDASKRLLKIIAGGPNVCDINCARYYRALGVSRMYGESFAVIVIDKANVIGMNKKEEEEWAELTKSNIDVVRNAMSKAFVREDDDATGSEGGGMGVR